MVSGRRSMACSASLSLLLCCVRLHTLQAHSAANVWRAGGSGGGVEDRRQAVLGGALSW
jgi:hypothetical protein